MDRRRALVIAVGVLLLVAKCKKAYPSAYEHITSQMGITDTELIKANEFLQIEVKKEKLRGMAT
jgi:hypothetical protein